jgi:hypothetical protein
MDASLAIGLLMIALVNAALIAVAFIYDPRREVAKDADDTETQVGRPL